MQHSKYELLLLVPAIFNTLEVLIPNKVLNDRASDAIYYVLTLKTSYYQYYNKTIRLQENIL